MKAIVQRVKAADVVVNGKNIAAISGGLLVFLGVEVGDTEASAGFLAEKIANLRIFEDEAGKMNLSVRDVSGEVLVVSQFTLLADCRKGNRPAFGRAEKPERARCIYEDFINKIKQFVKNVPSGVFQETMLVNIANDGPVTIILEDRRGVSDAAC